MKILYLEDESALREWTADELRAVSVLSTAGYEIDDYFRIDQVKEYIEENRGEVALIITDLNMDDRWLGRYRNESCGGFLTGAVWLERFVYQTTPDVPTIIYSAYIDLLKKEKPHLINSNVLCVEKGAGEDFGFEGLLKAVEKILGFEGLRESLEARYMKRGV